MSNYTDCNGQDLGTGSILPVKSMGVLKKQLNLGRILPSLGYEYLYLENQNKKLPHQAAVLNTGLTERNGRD